MDVTIKNKTKKLKRKLNITEPISEPIAASVAAVEEIVKRCPKGTRKNKKTGLCEPTNASAVHVLVPVISSRMPLAPALALSEVDVDVDVDVPLQAAVKPTQSQAQAQAQALADLPEESITEENDLKKTLNDIRNEKEINEWNEMMKLTPENDEYSYLYPNLNDPNFNVKIAERKEFNDNKYDGKIYDVKEYSDILCKAEFELAPQQLFVRNFLSLQTPYNSLLLYHGLGSGKTCSAISVAEEMREYNKQMGIGKRIIVVASPNVQENFKVQLFDETKLKLINGLWNISSCTGNKLLKEINPMNMSGLTKENVVSQIKQIISKYYAFMGYTGFANYIIKSSTIELNTRISNEKREALIKKKLQKEFENRLIIIDEVHNIRLTDDNIGSKRIAQELFKLVNYVENLRLLLLSATPMYNSYKEIIWLLNLMNLNDKRAEIKLSEVFDEYGNFKMGQDGVEEIGKELLERKATGYISYVRGENPYTFPYRLWPMNFSPENTFASSSNANGIMYPRRQLNGMPIAQGIERVSLFLVNVGEYQQKGYDCFIQKINEGKNEITFDNMEAFGYTILQKPLQALNMIYPSEELDEILKMENPVYKNIDTSELIGESGLNRIITFETMPYNKETGGSSYRYNFEYEPESYKKYGKIFSPTEIGKYSGKIKNICTRIMNSSGIVMIYTQYIDGGAIPVALALEEMGFTRGDTQLSLFKTRKPAIKKIDAITFKTEEEHKRNESAGAFSPAKYIMITGDKGLSPNNAEILKKVNDESNKDGRKIKVVIISAAGSEGLDYKCIRQVHVMDPWYNMSRIEQIIGRAVRTCSHKNLPFEKRNVEIYLYGSLMNGEERTMKEAVDLYVYRLSELKAVQIGNVSRVLKEVSIDCILNYEQSAFTFENMNQEVELELSSGSTLDKRKIMYAIGDKPFSATCDYSDNCNYTCRPNKSVKDEEVKLDTYNEDFIMTNNDKIIQKIKKLMKEKFFYRKADLLMQINLQKVYPLVQINAALNFLVEDKYEYITDKYGRLGNLINIDDLYLFQPLEIKNPKISLHDRSVPIEFKRDNLAYKLPKVVKEIAIKPGKKVVMPEIANAALANDLDAPALNVIAMAKKDKALLKLLDQLKIKYNAASTIIKNASGRGEDDWYKLCSIVIELMTEENVSERDTLLDLLVDHIIDELKIDDFRLLLTSLDTLDLNGDDDFEKNLKKNIEKNIMITDDGLTGIFVNNIDNGENQLLIKSGYSWNLAKPMDLPDFARKIEEMKNKFLPSKTKMNNLVGFMGEFKKDGYMVYKLKDLSNKKNKGARCDQSGKTALPNLHKIIDSLDNEDDKEDYIGFMNKVEKLNHKQICIIQEMILRLFTHEKYNNKVWFLSAVEANLINVENIKI